MQLSEIREKFIELSGRYDMQGNTKSHFFINAGVRLLDRMSRFAHTDAVSLRQVPVGTTHLVLSDCQLISSVHFIEDGLTKYEVELIEHSEFVQLYPQSLSNMPLGRPMFCALGTLRHSPDLLDLSAEDFPVPADYALVAADYYSRQALYLGPAASTAGWLRIEGSFYSRDMSVDTDKSYWSVRYPDLLIKAALYQLEVAYRNTEGARDWMAAIVLELDNLDKDALEQHIQYIDQMEG